MLVVDQNVDIVLKAIGENQIGPAVAIQVAGCNAGKVALRLGWARHEGGWGLKRSIAVAHRQQVSRGGEIKLAVVVEIGEHDVAARGDRCSAFLRESAVAVAE